MGYLCRHHYGMVPRELSGYAAAASYMTAAHRAADRHHKAQLAAVRKLVREA